MPEAPDGPTEILPASLPAAIQDRFDVVSQMPEGVFGSAWLLQDRSSDDRKLARFIAPGPGAQSQFSAALRQVADKISRCPNAVPVVELIDGVGGVWMLRDWIVGESLAEALRTLTVLTHEQARTLIGSVCRGLLEDDQQHVVHGNLYPNNVLIDMNGRVFVSDHGLRALGAAEVGSKSIEFIAPELLEGGSPTISSDIYALGALLYLTLCGVYPLQFGANADKNNEILATHTILPPPSGIRLAGGIGNVIWRSFQSNADDRYANVEEFLEGLGRTRVGEPTSMFGRLQSGLIGD